MKNENKCDLLWRFEELLLILLINSFIVNYYGEEDNR